MQALHEKLDQNIRLRNSLDPHSAAHARLSERIDQDAHQLVECEDQLEREQQRSQAAHVEYQRQQALRQRESQESARRFGGFLVGILGAYVVWESWFSWWVLLGLVLAVVGFVNAFLKDK